MELRLFQFQMLRKSPISPHTHIWSLVLTSPTSPASLLDPLSSQGPAQHFRGALWLGAGEAPIRIVLSKATPPPEGCSLPVAPQPLSDQLREEGGTFAL